jgi:hypothetical protein
MRDFTVIRRRPNYVDIITPKRAGVYGYRLQAATNFDASFTTILTASIGSGYLDPNINPSKINAINAMDQIRIIFDPNTFTGTASITDAKQFWLRFVPVDAAGSAGTPGAVGLIVTDGERIGNSRMQIAGTAPQGAAVANSLRIDLPCSAQDFYIKNENAAAGNALFVSTQALGPEIQVSGQETLKAYDGTISSLYVRGSGGTAAFSASFSNYLPL